MKMSVRFPLQLYQARQELDRAWQELSQAGLKVRQIKEKLGGHIPDQRAINFIAADRPDAVYSFVFCTTRDRNEVWVYDGVKCPDAKTVEVVWKEGN